MNSIPVLYQDIQTRQAKSGLWVGVSPTGWYAVDTLDFYRTVIYTPSIVPYNVTFINLPWYQVQELSIVLIP